MSCAGNREETAGRTNHVEFAYCQDRLLPRTMHDRNGFIDQLHQACVGHFVNVVANEETHRPGTPSRFSRIIFNSHEDFERDSMEPVHNPAAIVKTMTDWPQHRHAGKELSVQSTVSHASVESMA